MNIKEFCGVDSFGKRKDGTEITHDEKFGAVVNKIGLEKCIKYIPATKEQIKEAYKEDRHLNNIPLKKWDAQHFTFKDEFYKVGINSISLSDTVCTLKQAVRLWIRSDNNATS